MRPLGHKLPPDELKLTQSLYKKSQGEMAPTRATHLANKNAEYFKYMLKQSLVGAAMGWVFDAPPKEVLETLRKGIEDAPFLPKFGLPFDPGQFRAFLGAGLLVQDPKVTPWMLDLPREFFSRPDIEYSDAAYLLIEAMQAGGKADKTFSGAVKKLAAAVTPKKLIVNPRAEKAFFDPLIALLEAIVAKDQAGFDKAWKKKEEVWRKFYSRPAEIRNTASVLDYVALGIGRIAEKHGLNVPTTNPYAPVDLLQTKA